MHTEQDAPATARYDDDFYAWVGAQSAAIRERRWTDIDVDHLIEEIDSLGRSAKQQLRNRVVVLLTHLLKKEHQTERASRSWENTIAEHTERIEQILEESPSLRPVLPDVVDRAYRLARFRAARETRLPLETFPETISPSVRQQLAASIRFS
jgi:hypothetical protein